ncbi:hypothetical protein AC1031_018317 [Aphanomyces cochlioides]|nr:hypothetical protein AC1031_018317 [Aphanomyces cochlioides]
MKRGHLQVLGIMAAAVNASLTLTQCWRQNGNDGSSVPCLNNTANGTITYFPLADNQSYSFANLNISDIQALPPDARWIDLSFNNLSQISSRIPPTLAFLNLSHNALRGQWIQTPLTVKTLDVSYNQGGLPWIQNVLWGISLPILNRLVFRGNNLTSIRWGYDNFPTLQLSAVDLTGNPITQAIVENSVNLRIGNYVTLTMDPNSYYDALAACGNPNFIRQIDNLPVVYLPNGEAQYDKSVPHSRLFLCVPVPESPPDPNVSAMKIGLIVLSCVIFLMIVALIAMKLRAKWRDRYHVYLRGTICSSNCSAEGISSDPVYQQQPPTARTD